MKIFITILILFFEMKLHAVMPVVDAGALEALFKQYTQGQELLQKTTQQVEHAKNLYDTAQQAIKYQGDPSKILGGIKDASLGGALHASSIDGTFTKLLGNLNNVASASAELQGMLGKSISVNDIKSELLAGQTPSNNLSKYQMMEELFDQQSQQIHDASAHSARLRAQLVDLRTQVASSQDQATTEKLGAAIDSTAAALATTDATIAQLHEQLQLSAQMVQNRKMLEEAAYQEAYKHISDAQAHATSSKIKEGFQNINHTR
jgi:hypothetical protein